MEKKYTFEDLKKIIEILRSENGCPWDRVQTHESLKPCLMEEAAEAAAGIRIFNETGNDTNLKEELGDVLLQVMMHSQIAKEDGRFTIEDVISGISKKMIRRHPHVFSDRSKHGYSSQMEIHNLVKEPVETAGQVAANWEEIKRLEKQDTSAGQSELKEIPLELPALARGQKVLKKAEKLYGKSETLEVSLLKILGSAQRLTEELTEEETKAAIKELLLSVVNVTRIKKVHGEQVLSDGIDDMIEECEKNGVLTGDRIRK